MLELIVSDIMQTSLCCLTAIFIPIQHLENDNNMFDTINDPV